MHYLNNMRDKSLRIHMATAAKNSSKKPLTHYACRTTNANNIVKYQVGKNENPVERPIVPDDKVSWASKWTDYNNIVVAYTSQIVSNEPEWADPKDPQVIKNWNQIDGKIDRRSFHGKYEINPETLAPLNPIGRTGICERGLLGKWGPNHAADPIVTRWKPDAKSQVKIRHPSTNRFILQFVAIRRTDTKQWAIPGGMCDPGENISVTLKREFMEEALNSDNMDAKEKNDYQNHLRKFFNGGVEIYKGYVDDPRNTDNAWMETTAFHFHDDDGSTFRKIKLNAGDDASHVKWMDITSTLELYASHKEFIHKAASRLNAHW